MEKAPFPLHFVIISNFITYGRVKKATGILQAEKYMKL